VDTVIYNINKNLNSPSYGFEQQVLNNLEGEAMDMITSKKPMISRALTVEDVFVKNDEERRLYELREKGRLEFQNTMFTAERRDRQEGIEEGR
jgi:hypothetical protein